MKDDVAEPAHDAADEGVGEEQRMATGKKDFRYFFRRKNLSKATFSASAFSASARIILNEGENRPFVRPEAPHCRY